MNAMTQMLNTAYMVERMSNEAYHSRPEFSSSQLKDMLRSGAHFYSHNIAKEHERETKKHLDLGTLAHSLFLEPELFQSEFALLPLNAPRKPTEAMLKAKNPSPETLEKILWWERFEAKNSGKIVVSEEQIQGAQRIVATLQSLGMYKEMLNNYGMPEASIFFTDPTYSLQLRVRPDWHIAPCSKFPNGLIIDVKTANDARFSAFSKACGNYAYDLSAAMYREGMQQYYGTEEKAPFVFMVAENDAPFVGKQYKADDIFLAVGAKRYEQAKEKLAESLLLNEWDGYSTELEEISLPNYLVNKALDF